MDYICIHHRLIYPPSSQEVRFSEEVGAIRRREPGVLQQREGKGGSGTLAGFIHFPPPLIARWGSEKQNTIRARTERLYSTRDCTVKSIDVGTRAVQRRKGEATTTAPFCRPQHSALLRPLFILPRHRIVSWRNKRDGCGKQNVTLLL